MCLIKKGGRFRHKKTFPFSDSSEKKPFHDYQKKTHTQPTLTWSENRFMLMRENI